MARNAVASAKEEKKAKGISSTKRRDRMPAFIGASDKSVDIEFVAPATNVETNCCLQQVADPYLRNEPYK